MEPAHIGPISLRQVQISCLQSHTKANSKFSAALERFESPHLTTGEYTRSLDQRGLHQSEAEGHDFFLNKMSLQQFLQPSDKVFFVSDLLRQTSQAVVASGALPTGNTSQRPGSIYERVQEKQRQLENERWSVECKKRKLQEVEEETAALTKKYQARLRRAKELEAEELRQDIEHIESGAKLQDFQQQARPYLREYQRQQFCRNLADEAVAQSSTDAKVVEDFLANVEGIAPKFSIQNSDVCTQCHEPLQLHQALSMLVCGKCGVARPFLDANASLLAYSDDIDFSSFSYKRINHFTEWLRAVQGAESVEVPEDVFHQIMQRLYDERVSPDAVTIHTVREVLKRLKLRKYYEHAQLITSKLTGRSAPKMTPEMEERIKVCFLAASSSFQRICPPSRRNFISYSHVTRCLCQALGFTEFLPFFQPLKSREKMAKADECWRLICEDLGWPYEPFFL